MGNILTFRAMCACAVLRAAVCGRRQVISIFKNKRNMLYLIVIILNINIIITTANVGYLINAVDV